MVPVTSSPIPLSQRLPLLLPLLLMATGAHCWPWKLFDGPAKTTVKAFNFLPIPETECLSDDKRRMGVCRNAYECRMDGGKSHGSCHYGFGVCCIFTTSCDEEVKSNVTYFVNPNFPGLLQDAGDCSLRIKKTSRDISQIRLDFLNFNLAQPNRKTGVCETDTFVMTGGSYGNLRICGVNSGQHVYYDVADVDDAVMIDIRLKKSNYNRMWEIKITQIPFAQRAPAGCLQYFEGASGTVQTMNFAVNGRHLADQDYVICIRQEQSMCSIVYEPCDENSFKIGSPVYFDVEFEGSGDDFSGRGGNQSVSTDVIQECSDRVTMQCDSEEFLTPEGEPGICDLVRCGKDYCTDKEQPCRIEISITPFAMRVQFGPGDREENPDDNLGVCITYEQQRCSNCNDVAAV